MQPAALPPLWLFCGIVTGFASRTDISTLLLRCYRFPFTVSSITVQITMSSILLERPEEIFHS
jgi:hypothetical protein